MNTRIWNNKERRVENEGSTKKRDLNKSEPDTLLRHVNFHKYTFFHFKCTRNKKKSSHLLSSTFCFRAKSLILMTTFQMINKFLFLLNLHFFIRHFL